MWKDPYSKWTREDGNQFYKWSLKTFSDIITALFAEVTLLVHIQGLRIQHLYDNPILLFFIPSITTVNFYLLAPHSKKNLSQCWHFQCYLYILVLPWHDNSDLAKHVLLLLKGYFEVWEVGENLENKATTRMHGHIFPPTCILVYN